MKNTPLHTWVQEMPMNFSLQETTMNHQLKSQNLLQFAPLKQIFNDSMILVLASACWTTFPIASPSKSSFKKPQNALSPVLSTVDLHRAASYISNEVRNTVEANSVFTVKQLSCTLVFPIFEIWSCYSGKNCNNELDKGSKDCTSKITKFLISLLYSIEV